MYFSKYLISLFAIGMLLLTTQIEAQQLPREQKNWEYINHDAFGTNHNPQTQINKRNVQSLELKWTYQIPPVSQQESQLLGFPSIAEGSMSPPLVVDGITYIVLNSKMVIALDAKTGKEIWRHITNFDSRNIENSYPLLAAYALGHTHGIYYIDGKIWLNDFACKITVLDAKTGNVARTYEDLCKEIPLNSVRGFGVPTNSGYYAGGGSHPPSLYQKENIVIWGVGGASEGTWGGRAYEQGMEAETGKVLWRFFYAPPCGDPATCKPEFEREKQQWGQWLVDHCNKIWIQQIKSCELDQDLLRNDWGKMRFNSGISNVWGQRVIDEETGIYYFGTAQPGPNLNATHSPGFRLFSSSIIALNSKTGELVWAHQTTARNLWDYDCGWNTILANAKIKGQTRKVVIKGCKNGIVYVLDAATGDAYHLLESPDIKRTESAQLLNPRNKGDMVKPWVNYPKSEPFWMNCNLTGCLESDIAYDPVRNIVYFATYNSPGWNLVTNADLRGNALGGRGSLPDRPFVPKINYTINAYNIDDGSLKWKYFVDGFPFRGGVMVSGGLVWFSAPDGIQRALNADNGNIMYEQSLGSSTLIQPTMGADSDGRMKFFRIVGGHAYFQNIINQQGFGSNTPGAIMAYGLPDNLQIEPYEDIPESISPIESLGQFAYPGIGITIAALLIASILMRKSKKKVKAKRKK